MPRKSMRSRSRSRRGGFDFNSLNPFASKKPDDTDVPPPAYPPPTSSGMGYSQSPTSSGMGYSQPPTNSSNGYGGKKGKRRRSMRGGDYTDNISLNNLASNAAPISGTPTASALYVGGRTRRHRHNKSCQKSCRRHHRHNKSCQKSCRKH